MGKPTEFLFNDQYTAQQLERYKIIFRLIKDLNIDSVFDCGCGTGSLLNYLINKKEMEPFGVELNPVAMRILKRKILSEFSENFDIKDLRKDEIHVDADLCIIFTSFLGK
ncbi:MAG: methionine biosynthesis protein MetW, partial [Candidatus Woesearchaeota archaeon]